MFKLCRGGGGGGGFDIGALLAKLKGGLLIDL